MSNFLRLWAFLGIVYGVVQWTIPGGHQEELLGILGFLIATVAFGCSWIIDGLEILRKTIKEDRPTEEPKEGRRVINLR